MTTGTRALKELVCAQIAELDIYGDEISQLSAWDGVSTYLLKFSLRSGFLTEADVRIEIHKRLLELGRKSFDQHMKTKTYPDHVSSPHAFAYAIHNDAFSSRELRHIEFDHGETLETFMAGEIHDLPEKILNRMLRWKKRIPQTESGFPACC